MCADGTVSYWDKDSKQRLHTLPKAGTTIPCTAFNRTGNIFAYAVSYDWTKSRAALYVEDDDAHTITSSVQVDLAEQLNEPTELYDTGPISHIVLPKKKQTSKKKLWACFIIVLFVILVVIAYFSWPRIPRLIIQNETAERIGDPVNWGPQHQPWLKAAWQFNVTLDNHMNYVPTRIQEIQVILKDRDTLQPFAWS
ncbi:hypothetical protein CU098_004200, partial [Rhizopus stolonifer]